MDRKDDARNTKKIFQNILTKNDLRGEPRLDGKMMWRMTYDRWGLLIGDK